MWLIFVLTVFWTSYPRAFESIVSTLAIPLFIAALGILFRGAAYALRAGASSVRESGVIDTIFSVSSVLTPFALGAAIGAIATDRVPARQRQRAPVLELVEPDLDLHRRGGGDATARIWRPCIWPPTRPGLASVRSRASVPAASAGRGVVAGAVALGGIVRGQQRLPPALSRVADRRCARCCDRVVPRRCGNARARLERGASTPRASAPPSPSRRSSPAGRLPVGPPSSPVSPSTMAAAGHDTLVWVVVAVRWAARSLPVARPPVRPHADRPLPGRRAPGVRGDRATSDVRAPLGHAGGGLLLHRRNWAPHLRRRLRGHTPSGWCACSASSSRPSWRSSPQPSRTKRRTFLPARVAASSRVDFGHPATGAPAACTRRADDAGRRAWATSSPLAPQISPRSLIGRCRAGSFGVRGVGSIVCGEEESAAGEACRRLAFALSV